MPTNRRYVRVVRVLALALFAAAVTLPASSDTTPGSEASDISASQAKGTTYALRPTAGGRLLLDARVNGHPVEALLDSAAEASLLDTEFARQVGLLGGKDVTARGSGASTTKAQVFSGVTLEAFGLKLTNQTVGVLDLADVGKRLFGRPLPFVLGREVFDHARLQIDIEGLTARVVDASEQPKGMRLPVQSSHGVPTIPVILEGRPAQAAFDLGNGTRPLLGGKFADAAKMVTDGRPVQEDVGGGIGGEVRRQVIALKSVELAGKRFDDVVVAVDRIEHAHDFNVGISLLRHYRITTDFKEGAVWLEPRD